MDVFLTILSGACWTAVYVLAIVIGIRQRTFAIPLWALGLNITWEVIYAIVELGSTPRSPVQGAINAFWACLDSGIVYTYLRYGRRYWPGQFGSWLFAGWTFLVFGSSLAIQLGFLAEFGRDRAPEYSAFLQNLLMSVLFITMFVARRGPEGQSIWIAVLKWIGTLIPTIQIGALQSNGFILMLGILCSVFDLIYVTLLSRFGRTIFWTVTTPPRVTAD